MHATLEYSREENDWRARFEDRGRWVDIALKLTKEQRDAISVARDTLGTLQMLDIADARRLGQGVVP